MGSGVEILGSSASAVEGTVKIVEKPRAMHMAMRFFMGFEACRYIFQFLFKIVPISTTFEKAEKFNVLEEKVGAAIKFHQGET